MSMVLNALVGNVQAAQRIQKMRTNVQTQLDDGVKCPCCGQFAKVYKRKINSKMTRSLITMWNAGADTIYVHTPSLTNDHEVAQLSWWGLIEEEKTRRPDGGRSGYWKITDVGVGFITNRGLVPEFAHIYNGEVLGFSGDPVGINKCLGVKFDLADLMSR